jgi:hypothetical protein
MSRRFRSPSLKSLLRRALLIRALLIRAVLIRAVLIWAPALGLIVAGGSVASAAPAPHPLISAWNGYVDTNSAGNTYQKASGSWVQPMITCGASTTGATFWVGIDGYTSDTVEQVGTGVNCSGGTATYYAWLDMYPAPPQVAVLTIKPGDHITASVSKSGKNYTLALTDNTTGHGFDSAQTCAPSTCKDTSAEWIEETSGGPVLGAWKVKGATVKSGSVTGVIATFPHVALGTAGPLNAAGNGFTVP